MAHSGKEEGRRSGDSPLSEDAENGPGQVVHLTLLFVR
jgi:hypothetical protein